MSQEFKQELYKKVTLNGIDFYLFDVLESFNSKDWSLVYIRVTKDKQGKNFIVESGAGITKERMLKQIMNYLNKKVGLKWKVKT